MFLNKLILLSFKKDKYKQIHFINVNVRIIQRDKLNPISKI